MKAENQHHYVLFKNNDTLMITYFKTYTDHVHLVHRMAPHPFILLQDVWNPDVCKILIEEGKANVDCQRKVRALNMQFDSAQVRLLTDLAS